MRSAFVKTVFRSIKNSFGRFIAIFAIIALGVGFFAGLKATRPSFLQTAQSFFERYRLNDFRLLSTIGIDDEDIEYLSQIDGVSNVEGEYNKAVLVSRIDRAGEIEYEYPYVVDLHSLTSGVNELSLVAGRLPSAPNEIVLDEYVCSSDWIGDTIEISQDDEDDSSEGMAVTQFTVVGLVRSPEYINFKRGTTDVGGGQISFFAYVPREAFDMDYYTQALIYYGTNFEIYSEEYVDYMSSQQEIVENRLEEAVNTRFNDFILESQEEIDDGWNEYNESVQEALDELYDARATLDDSRLQLLDAQAQIDNATQALSEADDHIAAAYEEVNSNFALLETQEQELVEAGAQLSQAYVDIETNRQEATSNLDSLTQNAQDLNDQIEYLTSLLPEGQTTSVEIETANAQLVVVNDGITQANEAISQIDAAQAALDIQNAEYLEGLEEVRIARVQLEEARTQLDINRTTWQNSMNELQISINDYNEGYQEFVDGEQEYFDGVAEFGSSSAEAKRELVNAQMELDKVEEPSVFVLGRDMNQGYVSFENDSSIVDGVATVFPLFFFMIAALVCSTTMQRMVSDERTQIGIMRALGYSEFAIIMKYVTYSGLAAILGGTLGYLGGIRLFPYVIWEVYGMMYGFSGIVFQSDVWVLIVSMLVALTCSVLVTIFTAKAEMACTPADLIRPKAPLPGKRILLERITIIWRKMKFFQKVSARNIFRFKKRMFMMIVGIAGCTSLVITGFGISDSIKNIVDTQYDRVLKYDLTITFEDSISKSGVIKSITDLDEEYNVEENHVLARRENVTHTGNDLIRDVELIASSDPNVSSIFGLMVDGNSVEWPSFGTVAISSKLADKNNIKAGDSIVFSYGDNGQTVEVQVAYVFDNYIFHYAIMSEETYADLFDEEYKPNTALISIESDNIIDTEYAKLLSDITDVKSWSATSSMRDTFQATMNQLNLVVILIIGCAAALAFIVLFNLDNINISERIREIATLKVLGFSRNETNSYVFRENSILVLLSFVVGIPLGIALHAFVMAQIDMDTVSFVVQILPISYVYSLVTVIVFTIIVELIMHRKIDKIDMAESLKSIE